MTLLRNVKNEIEPTFKLLVECFTVKYFQSSGRSNRRENLIFCLFDTIISFVIYFIPNPLFHNIYMLITITPYLALSVRRLHDINKTGWWVFAMIPVFLYTTFVDLTNISETPPIAGTIFFILTLPASGVISLWLIICMFFFKGTPGPNKYGEPPVD
ncbi:MAG: DUF805 domain-containing protein [Rickettsiaceae bacterium]|jgi:uncharacterized membrane protein YhaH (DUF805 family)|nr:DUF805 domain-containing protein [Rickettsiaceae bacterium]